MKVARVLAEVSGRLCRGLVQFGDLLAAHVILSGSEDRANLGPRADFSSSFQEG